MREVADEDAQLLCKEVRIVQEKLGPHLLVQAGHTGHIPEAPRRKPPPPLGLPLAPLAEEYGFSYIGGHPMAGRERGGFTASTEDLYVGASMILTPDQRTDMKLLETLSPGPGRCRRRCGWCGP